MKRILVIDDDQAILEATTLALESEGYTVSHIPSYLNFSIPKGEIPSVILLDMILSGADGRDIVKKIKKDPETKHIPVIMLSAHPSARESVLESGADAFLAKPYDLDELYMLVKKFAETG